MARKLRVQYPGAVYHVMNRGDWREDTFKSDNDRWLFLETLGQALEKPAEWGWGLGGEAFRREFLAAARKLHYSVPAAGGDDDADLDFGPPAHGRTGACRPLAVPARAEGSNLLKHSVLTLLRLQMCRQRAWKESVSCSCCGDTVRTIVKTPGFLRPMGYRPLPPGEGFW